MKLPIRCPKGTKVRYRFKKGRTKSGKRVRLGGCAKKGRFIKIKEIKVMNGRKRIKRL